IGAFALFGVALFGAYCFGLYQQNAMAKQQAYSQYLASCVKLLSVGVLGTPPELVSQCEALRTKAADPPPNTPSQKIGLLEFDSFNASDIADWLTLLSLDLTTMNRLSMVPVNGGIGNPGPNESEVLLDIDMVMSLTALIPDTQYVVYVAP